MVIEKDATPDGVPFIVISGEFTANDSTSDFVAAVASNRARAVTFNSPGGNVYAAIAFGRMIRALGLDTVQPRALPCMSACTLAFLGGVMRWAEPGAIGVHQHSFGPDVTLSTDEAVAATQMVTADVLDYLAEMGADASILKLALRYTKDDMRFLSGSEMAEMRVTTPAPDTGVQKQAEAPSLPAEPAPRSAPRLPTEDDLVTFVQTVLEVHSSDKAAALSAVEHSYASTVSYFGKTTTLYQVLADKSAYFDRWPERHYAIRSPSVSVFCNASTCEVRGDMDWSVRSLIRNRQAKGVAAFRYTVDVSNGMRIIGEDSAIVSR